MININIYNRAEWRIAIRHIRRGSHLHKTWANQKDESIYTRLAQIYTHKCDSSIGSNRSNSTESPVKLCFARTYKVGSVHCYQKIELILCIKSYSDCMGLDKDM